MMKKDYQPKARHDQLRTRIEKDKTKYDRNYMKQLDLYENEGKKSCNCWLNTGECYCKTI